MDEPRTQPIQISFASYLRVVAILFAVLLVWALRDIILLLFLSMVMAAAIGPWISSLSKLRIPRPVGVLIVYATLIAVLAAVVVLLIPAVTREAASISERFPDYYQRVTTFFNTQTGDAPSLESAGKGISTLSRGIFAGLRGVFGGFASFLLVLVMTFYFTVDEANLRRFWVRMTPSRYRSKLVKIADASADRIGSWFRGQLLISAAIGSISYLLFTLLGIPDALLLALIAGIASFVPLVGAFIGVIPAVFIALTSVSLAKAIVVLVVTVALYQVVTNVFVPKFMSRVVGLNPVVIILVMLLGAQFSGALGLILAIPIASIIDAIVRENAGVEKGMSHAG